MSEEGIRQAYRDIFGREGDEEGVHHHLTQGPKVSRAEYSKLRAEKL